MQVHVSSLKITTDACRPTDGNLDDGGPSLEVLRSAPPSDLRREVARRLTKRLNERLMAGAGADPVKLSQPGYRPRYYQQRFGATEGAGIADGRDIVLEVLQGLHRA